MHTLHNMLQPDTSKNHRADLPPPAPALRGRALAAPSWVFPGNIEKNCYFLAGKVQEVGLLFMENAPSMAYTSADLPPGLKALPLSWHVHLPSDLDWRDPQKTAVNCLSLMGKLGYLGATRAVLHPPVHVSRPQKIHLSLLRDFMLCWQSAGRSPQDIMLENQPGQAPEELLATALESGTSICLDLAHLLLSGRSAADISEDFMRRVRLLHLCAPGQHATHHRPLCELDGAGVESGRDICRRAKKDAVFMLELFHWPDYVESIPLLNAWME